MPTYDEEWAHLSTRVPKALRREVKLRCAATGTAVMRYVVAAVRERLDRVGTDDGGKSVGRFWRRGRGRRRPVAAPTKARATFDNRRSQ
jgi:hypothetical protein